MFESDSFHSWLPALFGGIIFAVVFGFLAMLSDVVLGEEMQVNQKALALGALAFVGYIGVAAILRTTPPQN